MSTWIKIITWICGNYRFVVTALHSLQRYQKMNWRRSRPSVCSKAFVWCWCGVGVVIACWCGVVFLCKICSVCYRYVIDNDKVLIGRMPLYRSYSTNKYTWNKNMKHTYNKQKLACNPNATKCCLWQTRKIRKKKFKCMQKNAHELNGKDVLLKSHWKSLLGFQPAISMQALRVNRNASDGSLTYSINQ